MHVAWQKRDLDTVFEIQDRLMPLHKALFTESSPGPIKYACSLIDKCRADIRLPLVEPGEASRRMVREAMVGAGLLN
jgi:4-hydroxy-tetrahydrodipicolinate synthase